jgi:DNA-binding transcriptional LysR family regulator
MDWDDLRYVLAVAGAGSLAGAARALGVNHTTVLRRIAAAEKRLGVRLFERLRGGYLPTAAGEELIEAARHIDAAVTDLGRRLAGRDLRLSGVVRVSTVDTLVASLLPEILAAFRERHPGIQVEVAVTNVMANLTRRDADVAIRAANDPHETLVGRRAGTIAFAIYGSRTYLATRRAGTPLDQHRWVAPDDSMAATSIGRWMRTALPEAEVALRADSLVTMRQAAAAGLGVAPLPCYLGDGTDGLVRMHPTIAAMATGLWILTHADLRETARVRAFTAFVAEAFAERRHLLEGTRSAVRKRRK